MKVTFQVEIKVVSITCSGNVTEETCNLFNRLKRTLPPGPDPVHLFAENFDVEMWNSDRIMEIDGKFRNKPFCCIKGPKCGSSHFFLHLSLLQKYYTHIYIENHSHRPDKIE